MLKPVRPIQQAEPLIFDTRFAILGADARDHPTPEFQLNHVPWVLLKLCYLVFC